MIHLKLREVVPARDRVDGIQLLVAHLAPASGADEPTATASARQS